MPKPPHRLNHLIASLGLAIAFFSSTILANNIISTPSHITVNGYPYAVALSQNHKLTRPAQGADITALHYQGKLSEREDSWVRISYIDGNWLGVVSLGRQIFLVDQSHIPLPPTHEPAPANTPVTPVDNSAASTAYATVSNTALAAEPIVDNINAQCGSSIAHRGSGAFGSSALGLAPYASTIAPGSALAVAERAAFSSLCSTLVDGVCLFKEIEFAFDQSFQAAFASTPIAEVQAQAIINIVEGYYRNDFNIVFDTITLELLNSSVFSSTTDADALLDDIEARRLAGQLAFLQGSQTIFHLITGRDFDGSTVGIAYVGELCNGFGLGTSQLIRDFGGSPDTAVTALVVAHELGHNFGSGHDGEGNSCSNGFIMQPSINTSSNQFSSCSQTAIQSEISSISSPAQCFNFPLDAKITASSNNPVEVSDSALFILDYDIELETAYVGASSLSVSGSVASADATITGVTINGNGCNYSNNNGSNEWTYDCMLSNPGNIAYLQVFATANVGTAQFDHQTFASNGNELIEVDSGNNSLSTMIDVLAINTAPASASGLTATPAANTQVQLNWQDNSSNEQGFRIDRQTDGGSFSVLATVGSDTNSYIDTDIIEGVNYGYRVTAFNGQGDANQSNIETIELIPPPDPPPPVSDDSPTNTQTSANSQGGGGGTFSMLPLLILMVSTMRRKR